MLFLFKLYIRDAALLLRCARVLYCGVDPPLLPQIGRLRCYKRCIVQIHSAINVSPFSFSITRVWVAWACRWTSLQSFTVRLRESYIKAWVVRVGQSVYFMINVSENKTHCSRFREVAQDERQLLLRALAA